MTKPDVTVGERPYHHGDLHRAIVSTALKVLRESQGMEFSLRGLARRAGVSHSAPYKHFADKRELLATVSSVGFELLAKRMSDAIEGLTDPRARVFAMARGYVRHGVENPTLYRLMFGASVSGPDDDRPAAIELVAAEKTNALLADAIIGGALGHPIANTPQNERMIAAALLIFWSQMHGLTLLLVDQFVGPNGNTDELAEVVLQGMLDGLGTRIPALPPGTWIGP